MALLILWPDTVLFLCIVIIVGYTLDCLLWGKGKR